jgi:hypothetical protein
VDGLGGVTSAKRIAALSKKVAFSLREKKAGRAKSVEERSHPLRHDGLTSCGA